MAISETEIVATDTWKSDNDNPISKLVTKEESPSGLDILTMVATASNSSSLNNLSSDLISSMSVKPTLSLLCTGPKSKPILPSFRFTMIHGESQVENKSPQRNQLQMLSKPTSLNPNNFSLHQHPRLPSILTSHLSFSRASRMPISPSSPGLNFHYGMMHRPNPVYSSPTPCNSPQSPLKQQDQSSPCSADRQMSHRLSLLNCHPPSPTQHPFSPNHPVFRPNHHLSSPPLSNCSPTSMFSSHSSTSPTTMIYSPSGYSLSSPTTHSSPFKPRTCSSCFADYSSGNWYKDKEQEGEYLCKSCYVCLQRKKRKLEKTKEVERGSDFLDISTYRVAMFQVRQRRRRQNTIIRKEMSILDGVRRCVQCHSSHSSGDWYRDKSGKSGSCVGDGSKKDMGDVFYNCQKCYQRLNREKSR